MISGASSPGSPCIEGVGTGARRIAIDELRLAGSPRLNGEDAEHVRLLAESAGRFPPILVHRATMTVIDGAHRVRAAMLLGLTEIEASFYDGAEKDGFVLAVTLNAAHGLPLTLADRRAAAGRIMQSHAQWSDRRIARITGLSGATVGAVRKRSTAQNGQSNTRVGRDGRARPVHAASGRARASELITERPDLSLRQIARMAEVAPSTVLDVRKRLKAGEDPLPPRQRDAEATRASAAPPPIRAIDAVPRSRERVGRDSVLQSLRNDPSLRFNEAGRGLLRWLAQRPSEDGELARTAQHVPDHCAATLAELIRGNVERWAQFAEVLEQRAASLGERSSAG